MSLKPNKTRLRLWVKWLLNPRHKQTKYMLRQGNSYCCLGGACEVYRVETNSGRWIDQSSEFHFDTGLSGDDAHESNVMPRPVAKWFGLDNANPELDTLGLTDIHTKLEASDLNDNEDWTFAQIAKAIVKTYGLSRKPAAKTAKKGKK